MLEIRAGMNVQASTLCQKALPACGCIRKPRSLEDATTVAVTTTVAQPVESSGGRNVQTKTLSMEQSMFEMNCYSAVSCMAEAPKTLAMFTLELTAVWLALAGCLYAICWMAGKALPYLERYHAYLQKRLS